MSVPYAGPGNRSDQVYEYDDSHSQGLVTFAGVMIMIAAVLNTLYGIAAIDKASFFVNDAKFVFADLQTFGWFVLVLGIVQFFAGAGDLERHAVGALVRRRLRERQRDPADALDPVRPGAGDDDPGPRHHRHLRPARLRRPAPRGARVPGA